MIWSFINSCETSRLKSNNLKAFPPWEIMFQMQTFINLAVFKFPKNLNSIRKLMWPGHGLESVLCFLLRVSFKRFCRPRKKQPWSGTSFHQLLLLKTAAVAYQKYSKMLLCYVFQVAFNSICSWILLTSMYVCTSLHETISAAKRLSVAKEVEDHSKNFPQRTMRRVAE